VYFETAIRSQFAPTKCGKNISSSLQGERLSIFAWRGWGQQSLLLLAVIAEATLWPRPNITKLQTRQLDM
jgi:hypothetical protein